MLKQRVLTAAILVPLAGAAIWFDEPLPWFTLLAGAWGILALREFYHLTPLQGGKQPVYLALGLLIIISPHLGVEAQGLMLSLTILVTLTLLLFSSPKETAFRDWCWGIGGIVYISWLVSYFVALSIMPQGRNWVLFTLVTIMSSDTGAFFIGRALGRHQLAPRISPKKTWEGAIAGLFIAMLISLLFTLPQYAGAGNALYIKELSLLQGVLLAALVSIMGQLGDLVESLFKRSVGVKDSGRVLPGHGGFLDRLDSLLFCGIAVYYYVQWFGG